ncbi:MAG: DUF4012 domain-containing protein [Caldilineaceae bacterium]
MSREIQHSQNRPKRRRRQIMIGSVLGLLLALLLFKLVRVSIYLVQAYSNGQQFTELVRGNFTAEQFPTAQALLQASATAVVDAKEEATFFSPLLTRLQWLPAVGPTLAALPSLAEVSADLAQLAVQGFAIAQPILLTPAGASPITQLPIAFSNAQPTLDAMRVQAAAIEQKVQQIDADQLALGLREPVQGLQASVALINPALRLGAYLPEALGVGKNRTYLVLAQNNHELRATGGFVTAVGLVTIADGRIVGIDFMDSYDKSISRTDLPLPRTPDPVRQFMGIDIMLLRDANWSPDFPTTAQIVRTLYNQQTGRTVDGVITIDLHAVELLVGALEPLKLPDIDEPLTGATVVERIKQFWAAPIDSDAALATGEKEWWKQRKDFIPRLAKAAITRIQRGNFNYLRMVAALNRALSTRALQLWVDNPQMGQELARLEWDGGLQPPKAGDFLAVVDSNFGYNKVDAVLERSVQYQVQWSDSAGQPGVATIALTYHHPYARTGYVCDQRPHYEESYEEMMVRCYYDYVRLYAPAGSELIATDGFEPDTVTSQRGEGGAQVFSGFFIMEPGATKTVYFQYHLPPQITAANYTLRVRRQAGTGAVPLVAQVGNSTLSTSVDEGSLVWQPTVAAPTVAAKP